LQPDKLHEQLLLGLEQTCDTMLPEVHLRPRFKPFVEDELPSIVTGTTALVAHPVADSPFPASIPGPTTLAIGPEGGFIPYEVEKFQECGFASVSLGERILRVETAVPVLLSRFL
jgi:16S rRNA (uracil1498-N3)-methyltransferase